MKFIKRAWHARRLSCLQTELAAVEHWREKSGEHVEHILKRIAAERWHLTALDRPPITHAPGRQRSDGKIRSITTEGTKQ